MDMRILSVINLKGGVAKTISSVAIAHLLAEKGFRVLLVDNDKQGDASRGYRRRDEDGAGIDEIMTARRPDMGSLIQHTDFPGLDIITANMKLLKANLEVLLDQTRQQQTRLKKALEQVRDQYVSLYDLGFMPERDHKFAVKVAGVTQQYNIERAHHEDGEIILELGALGER